MYIVYGSEALKLNREDSLNNADSYSNFVVPQVGRMSRATVMNARCEIGGPDVLRIVMMMVISVITALFDIECANATSVVACEPVSLSQVDKAQVEGLAKNLVAPQLIDESRNISCKQREKVIAAFQTIPALAADGALETRFATCHRGQRWECDLAVERAIDLAEANRSATVRITSRDDLSADWLRALYIAALDVDSTSADPACRTSAERARSLRTLFVQSSSKKIKVSRDGELFDVERDHIEIKFSIEEDAKGVKTIRYRCVTQWPSGDPERSN